MGLTQPWLAAALLSEIVDNVMQMGHSGLALYKWRQYVAKLKKLKDVHSSNEDGASTLECCICLGEIKTGKQLSCSHV